MVTRHTLSCCALAQVTCSDHDSLEEIKYQIDRMKREAPDWWFQVEGGHGYGQRACFVITINHETNLIKNLKKLKFKPLTNFDRRVGYPKGYLTMWFLNW